MRIEPSIPASDAHDLVKGLAFLTRSALLGDVARLVGDLNPPDLHVAFNAKQIASKRWLVETAPSVVETDFETITVLGGWYGVLPALILDDARWRTERIVSVDIDPACEPVARLLNRRHQAAGRFEAITADMYGYAADARAPERQLFVNTSAEHIADLRAWLDILPAGALVAVQSNDYRAVPEHLSCVDSEDELAANARLSRLLFKGRLKLPNYTRFMIIGRL